MSNKRAKAAGGFACKCKQSPAPYVFPVVSLIEGVHVVRARQSSLEIRPRQKRSDCELFRFALEQSGDDDVGRGGQHDSEELIDAPSQQVSRKPNSRLPPPCPNYVEKMKK